MADRRLPLVPKLHDDGNPHQDEHDETTHAELFYDLFFVANLAVFTNIHGVSDIKTLEQYICFFCLLWFTWYQVALYDVRFAKVDCLTNRICKALQFGFMVAFAAVGPMFQVGEARDERNRSIHHYLRALTLALMGSRIVLTLQYALARYLIHHSHGSQTPLLMLCLTYASASALYGGMFGAFRENSTNYEFVAWYVIGSLESIVATFANGKSEYLTFNDTHLVQRMSLLTLIILGEGAIGLGKQCQVISEAAVFDWNATNLASIISSVLIVYFLYIIYFDWIKDRLQLEEYKQRVWACLHFPLHLALVLAVQGVALCIIWGAAMAKIKQVETSSHRWVDASDPHWENDLTNHEWAEAHFFWNATTTELFSDQGYNTKDYAGAIDTMNDIKRVDLALPLFNTSLQGLASARRAYDLVHYTSHLSIYSIVGFHEKKNLTYELEEYNNYTTYDFNINDTQWDISGERTMYLDDISGKFHLTFTYLFVSIGVAMIVCAALGWLVLSSQEREFRKVHHWLRLGLAVIVGLTLCLLTTMASKQSSLYSNFIESPGLLPTIAVLLFTVTLIHSVDLSGLWHTARQHYVVSLETQSHEVLRMETYNESQTSDFALDRPPVHTCDTTSTWCNGQCRTGR